MKFPMRRLWVLRPLYALFGGVGRWSYAEIDGDGVFVRFGFFKARVPFENIASVEAFRLPWWAISLGWRTDLRHRIGLLGAMSGVVKLKLARPQGMSLFAWVPCDELYVSLEDPEAFVRATGSRALEPRIAVS